MTSTNTNYDNCSACANNTCTEVYHRQIRDQPEQERGILGKVKDTVEGAYEKVTGKDKDPEYQCKKEFKKCENRAEELTKEGRSILHNNDKDVKKAEKLQKEAAEKSAKANAATNHALNKQIEGQDKLAVAGEKMMEAGAKLQQSAFRSGQSAARVPINDHQTGQVLQATGNTGGCAQVVHGGEEVITRQTRSTGFAK